MPNYDNIPSILPDQALSELHLKAIHASGVLETHDWLLSISWHHGFMRSDAHEMVNAIRQALNPNTRLYDKPDRLKVLGSLRDLRHPGYDKAGPGIHIDSHVMDVKLYKSSIPEEVLEKLSHLDLDSNLFLHGVHISYLRHMAFAPKKPVMDPRLEARLVDLEDTEQGTTEIQL